MHILVHFSATLTGGSLGTIRVPVKTTTGAPTDAQMGNLDACFGYNSADNTLEVRDGADTYLSVGVAGYVIQRLAPMIADRLAWYHQYQELGNGNVDETRCVVCGDEMLPGDQIALWANGRVRNDDLHTIFGHLHLERDSAFQVLAQQVKSLELLLLGKGEAYAAS